MCAHFPFPRYNLPKNAAILAEAKHEPMYEELINKYDIEYSAGGATQNTVRFCQWVVGQNNQVTTFVGSVGNDYFGKIMEKKAKGDGVTVRYQTVDDAQTGTCAVLINNGGKYRSLCAYLGAYTRHALQLIANFTHRGQQEIGPSSFAEQRSFH